jgi:hypothetical protein
MEVACCPKHCYLQTILHGDKSQKNIIIRDSGFPKHGRNYAKIREGDNTTDRKQLFENGKEILLFYSILTDIPNRMGRRK